MAIKIDNIIFCLRASNLEGSGASATSIMSAIAPEYIPGLFSFSVIVILLGIDTEKEHVFTARLCDPSGNSVSDITGTLAAVASQDNLPEEYRGLNVSIDFSNVDFKTSGLYQFNVYVDDINIGNKSIFVKGKNE